MTNGIFERPIFKSLYAYPLRHRELDNQGQPSKRVVYTCQHAGFITLIPKPRKREGRAKQQIIVFDEGKGLSTQEQRYDLPFITNELRREVDKWRMLSNSNDWQVTPETVRLLHHWCRHKFNYIQTFFCQFKHGHLTAQSVDLKVTPPE